MNMKKLETTFYSRVVHSLTMRTNVAVRLITACLLSALTVSLLIKGGYMDAENPDSIVVPRKFSDVSRQRDDAKTKTRELTVEGSVLEKTGPTITTLQPQNTGDVKKPVKTTEDSEDIKVPVSYVKDVSVDLHSYLDTSKGNMTVFSRGRLGNKLFQLAGLLGLSARLNMNPTYSNGMIGLKKFFELKQRPFSRTLNFSLSFKETTKMGGADPEILNINATGENIEIDGFFQCTDYFSNVEDILRKEIAFRPEVITAAEGKIEKCNPGLWKNNNVTKIGIHIRRGDFMKNMQAGRSVAPTEYYKKAMAYMLDKHPHGVFIITGNMKDWAVEELSDAGSLFFVEDGTPEEDMYLLSACDHVIMSSGSYSWWVGWLNKGTAVYYDLYPRPGSPLAATYDAKKYYLPHWIPLH